MNIWKGRFKGGLHPKALQFSSSLSVDRRLFEEDIDGSLAHVRMLARQKILRAADAKKIAAGLERVRRELRAGKLPLSAPAKGRFVAEDIHMAIEARLIDLIGETGGRLHTARSRNDQVALDERLFLLSQTSAVLGEIRALQKSLLTLARRYRNVMMPGYTHLQHGQPILLAHHLLAYIEMLDRDYGRFSDSRTRVSLSPLGAGALAGSSFPIDRRGVAKQLHLGGILDNSIDAVSDRDAILEFLAASAVTMMHLSRLAEELVLWSSREWGFIEIGDAFSTGSSIMPQKKNPDMAELVRGKTGRVYGDLIALLTTMKGLPLAYNRDMQEDKVPMFDAADTLRSSLTIMALMIPSVKVLEDRFEQELDADFSTATDLADFLVRKGMPFRQAHAVVGEIVQGAAERRVGLSAFALADLQKYSLKFDGTALALTRSRASIEAKKSAGSTSPAEVAKALLRWEKKLGRPRGRHRYGG